MDEVTKFAERLTAMESRAKSNTHRIDNIEKERLEYYASMNRMATAVERLANEQEHFAAEQQKISSRVEDLDSKVSEIELAPARRAESLGQKTFETLLNVILGAFVGAVMAWLLGGH